MNEEIVSFVDKAEKSLQAARHMYRKSFYDFAVSRAYYAMFYVASAALLGRGLRFRRHGALVAAFGQHFAKGPALSSHLQTYLVEAFEQRTRGDYQVLERVSVEEALRVLDHAEEFVSAVKAYLEKESQI